MSDSSDKIVTVAGKKGGRGGKFLSKEISASFTGGEQVAGVKVTAAAENKEFKIIASDVEAEPTVAQAEFDVGADNASLDSEVECLAADSQRSGCEEETVAEGTVESRVVSDSVLIAGKYPVSAEEDGSSVAPAVVVPEEGEDPSGAKVRTLYEKEQIRRFPSAKQELPPLIHPYWKGDESK